MKKILSIALIAIAAALPARAVIIGLDAGYLVDSQEEYVTGRIGLEFMKSDARSHIGELEVGYTNDQNSGVSVKILPATLNYRMESSTQQSPWGYFLGAGAGWAKIETSGVFTREDSTFAAQAFGGAVYRFSESGSINLGLKYIWINDVNLGFGLGRVEVGDDVVVSVGVGFKF